MPARRITSACKHTTDCVTHDTSTILEHQPVHRHQDNIRASEPAILYQVATELLHLAICIKPLISAPTPRHDVLYDCITLKKKELFAEHVFEKRLRHAQSIHQLLWKEMQFFTDFFGMTPHRHFIAATDVS